MDIGARTLRGRAKGMPFGSRTSANKHGDTHAKAGCWLVVGRSTRNVDPDLRSSNRGARRVIATRSTTTVENAIGTNRRQGR